MPAAFIASIASLTQALTVLASLRQGITTDSSIASGSGAVGASLVDMKRDVAAEFPLGKRRTRNEMFTPARSLLGKIALANSCVLRLLWLTWAQSTGSGR
jgi:hypothetical protein